MNNIYNLTKEDLIEITEQGAQNNILVYDAEDKSNIMTERLMYLIHTVFANVYDTSYTHLLVPRKSNLSKTLDFRTNSMILEKNIGNCYLYGTDKFTGKFMIEYKFYKDYLNYYKKQKYSLASGDSNLLIAINSKKMNKSLRKSVLLASF